MKENRLIYQYRRPERPESFRGAERPSEPKPLNTETIEEVFRRWTYDPELNQQDARDANLQNVRRLLQQAFEGRYQAEDIRLAQNRLPGLFRDFDRELFPLLERRGRELPRVREINLFRGTLVYKDLSGNTLLELPLAEFLFRAEGTINAHRQEAEDRVTRGSARDQERAQRRNLIDFLRRAFDNTPPPPLRRDPDTVQPDPLDARSQQTIETALDELEQERGRNLQAYSRVLDGIVDRDAEGYEERARIDQRIADLDEDEFRPQWSSIEGGREILQLFEEPAMNDVTLAYPEFLRARDASLREQIPTVIRTRLTGNLEQDLQTFRRWAQDIPRLERAGYEPSNIETLQYKNEILHILEILENYKRQSERVVYHVNPFLDQHWTIEKFAEVIGKGPNDELTLSDITDELYGENFGAVRRSLLSLRIAPETIQLIEGENLLDDYRRLHDIMLGIQFLDTSRARNGEHSTHFQRDLSATRPEVQYSFAHRGEVEKMYGVLGDYLVYARRLLHLSGRMRYRTPWTFQETAPARPNREQIRNHIQQLSAFQPQARYDLIRQNADQYQEFRELVHSLAVFPFSEQDQVQIFDEYFRLYTQMVERTSGEGPMLIQGVRFEIGMINGLPHVILPVAFSQNYRALVFRLTNTALVEQFSSRRAEQRIIQDYEQTRNFRMSDFQLTLDSPIIMDEHGNFVLRHARGGSTPIRRNFERLSQNRFEENLHMRLGESDENGLAPLDIEGAEGEIEIFIDPTLQSSVFCVHEGGRLFISLPRDTDIYITREDIQYPFSRGNQTQTTHIVIRQNPFDPRFGHGGLENRIPWYLYRYRTEQGFTEWEERENLRATELNRGQRPNPTFFASRERYVRFLESNQTVLQNRMRSTDLSRLEQAEQNLNRAIAPENAAENLPHRFGEVLAQMMVKLRADPGRLQIFRTFLSEQFDLDGNRIGPRILEKARELTSEIRNLFAETVEELSQSNSENMADYAAMRLNPLAISHVLSEIIFNVARSPDTPTTQAAFEQYLERFERPVLTAAFQQYFQTHESEIGFHVTTDDIQQMVGTVISDLKTTNIQGQALSERITEGTRFGSLMYHLVSAVEDPDYRQVIGIPVLFAPVPSRDGSGMISPIHLEYPLASEYAGQPARSNRNLIARFWLDQLSPFSPASQHFESLMSSGEENVRRMLRSPLALSLVRYMAHLVPAVFETEDLENLTHIYALIDGRDRFPLFNNPEDRYYQTAKKFYEFCQRVRNAQLLGQRELQIPGSALTLQIHTVVRTGVYRATGNVSALLEERFNILVPASAHMGMGRDVVTSTTELPEGNMSPPGSVLH